LNQPLKDDPQNVTGSWKFNIRVDDTTKLLSLAGSSFIFLSILKSFIFYNTFGIRITNYLNFSEALLLFIDEIAIFILYVFALFVIIGLIFFISKRLYRISFTDLFIPSRKTNLFNKSLAALLILYPLFYCPYAISKTVYQFYSTDIFWSLFIILYLTLGLVLYSLYLLWKKYADQRDRYIRLYIPAITLLYLSLFYLHFLNRQLFLFHQNKIYKSVSCYKDGKKQFNTMPDSIHYLGSTHEYIFFYNYPEKRAIIFESKKFDQVEFGDHYSNLPGFSISDILYY
jgi:hypothetical protein